MRKCSHIASRFVWRGNESMLQCCDDCGAMLSMGPSNDEPAEVQVEIRAADKLARLAEYAPSGIPLADVECDVWGDEYSFTFSGGPYRDEFNQALWPWDPARPVAGQYEEREASIAKVMAITGADRAEAEEAWVNGKRLAAEIIKHAALASSTDAADPTSDQCRRCTECVGQAHHWMENPDFEDARDAWFACKHCTATCDVLDDEAAFAEPSGVVRPVTITLDPPDATLAETLTDQTRHDVAASVARHADLAVAAANDVGAAAELYADMQRAWNSDLDADLDAARMAEPDVIVEQTRHDVAAAVARHADHGDDQPDAEIRDPNEPAPGWEDRVLAVIRADKPVLIPIDWPGYIGADKPTGDPLDAETRAAWNADLDVVERGS